MAEVLRHLGIEAHAAGRTDEASNAHRILEQVNEARAALPAQPRRHPA
jgi:hypothetical protein